MRSIERGEAEAFAAIGASGDLTVAALEELWASARSRPEWCLIAQRDGRAVGRLVARSVSPVTEGPPDELYLTDLVLPWEDRGLDVGLALVGAGLEAVGRLGRPVDARMNSARHDHLEERRTVFEAARFDVFQEKVGYAWEWRDPSSVPAPGDRLRFRTLTEVGRDAFIAALAAGGADTLDRNDRYYYRLTGPTGWGTEMMGYLGPGEDALWKLGYEATGELAGYVMVSRFEDGVATIIHIGVLPEKGGRGHIDELLAEAVRTAAEAGYHAMLSDVDVSNMPMRAAFERAGHSTTIRPWHVWHYRHEPLAAHQRA